MRVYTSAVAGQKYLNLCTNEQLFIFLPYLLYWLPVEILIKLNSKKSESSTNGFVMGCLKFHSFPSRSYQVKQRQLRIKIIKELKLLLLDKNKHL